MTYDPPLSDAAKAGLEAVRNMEPDEAANDNQADQQICNQADTQKD